MRPLDSTPTVEEFINTEHELALAINTLMDIDIHISKSIQNRADNWIYISKVAAESGLELDYISEKRASAELHAAVNIAMNIKAWCDKTLKAYENANK